MGKQGTGAQLTAPPCYDRHREQEHRHKHNKTKKMNTYTHKFNNIYSFAEFCNTAPVSKLFENESLYSDLGDPKFTGTKDFATANDLLRNGDQKSADKVKKEYTNIIARTKQNRPRPVPAIVGHTPIVGAFLAGDPVCMLAKKNRKTRARVVTIIYNTSVNCDIKADDMAKAGANLLAAINQIEANGVRVNLYAAEVSRAQDKEALVTVVRIKTDCQPLNIMQIAYPIANPSFLRRHIFRITEITQGLTEKRWVSGYGTSVHGARAKELLKGANVKYDSYLDYEDTHGTNPAQLVAKILENVK